MNILIVTREIPPVGGGAGHVAIHLAQQLAQSGHTLHIVTMGFGDLPACEQWGNITIHRVDCDRKNQDSSYLLEMLRYVHRARPLSLEIAKKNKCEIIHAHAIIPDGMIARYVARRTGVKYFITAHGSDVPGYNPDKFSLAHKVMTPWWHRSLRDAAAVITPSTYLAKLIRKARPAQDIEVIPNGILLDTFTARPRTEDFLIVSRLVKRKNYHRYFKALSEIEKPQTIHIVGEGPTLEELKTLAATLTQHTINFHGWLANGSKAWKDLYETCRYFVFPSESENFPINLLEAQLAGLVVLASDIPGNREVLGEHAVYFSDINAASIARTLTDVLIRDQSHLDELTRNGEQRVRQNFGWPHIAKRYIQVFKGGTTEILSIDPTH